MKVAVHFGVDALAPPSAPSRSDAPRGGLPTNSPPPRRETWGMLCQRFVESRLHHPSRLLRMLNSLQPGGRSYKLRYGGGRATIIHPAWSERGLNAGAVLVKEEGAMVEANVTLRPRKRSLGEDSTQLHVDFHIEKIGMDVVDADYDDGVVPFLSQDPPRGGSFPMTQDPFPTDDSMTHVLRLKEHDQFEGVVDNFSIKKLNGEDVERADVDYCYNRKTSHGETGATPAIGPAASAKNRARMARKRSQQTEKERDERSATECERYRAKRQNQTQEELEKQRARNRERMRAKRMKDKENREPNAGGA